MDGIWKSGIVAGIIGFWIILVNLAVIGVAVKNFADQLVLFTLMLLAIDALAFIVAGLISGIWVSQYGASELDSFKSGFIAGGVVALVPIWLILFILTVEAIHVISTGSPPPWSGIIGGIILIPTLIAEASLSGLISLAYARYAGHKKQGVPVAAVSDEDTDLIELRAAYDDLWKDARTMAADMKGSIQMYLLVGFFALIFGLVFAAYALASWQRIYAGSTELADIVSAIGETIGAAILIIAGPLLINWYLKLRARYSRLEIVEHETGE